MIDRMCKEIVRKEKIERKRNWRKRNIAVCTVELIKYLFIIYI